MAIAIVSANTGNGHRAVMNALIEGFITKGYDNLIIHDSFYEQCLISNKILSDFYNFLISVSIPLGEKYTEFGALTRPDMSDQIYNASYEKLCELVEGGNLEAIISTAPLINYSIVRILQEKELTEKIPFYIVVTDPFDPIAPGFDVQGAVGYFCFSMCVKNILANEGITESLIHVTNYPISTRFFKSMTKAERKEIYAELKLDSSKKTILINSGAYGNHNFLPCLKQIDEFDKNIQVIFICGKNKALKVSVDNYIRLSRSTNVIALTFVDNMDKLLEIANVCIAKAGANTFYECLAKNTFLMVNAVDGFLYQEKGVKNVIEKEKVGSILYRYEDIPVLLNNFNANNISSNANFSNSIKENGAVAIVDTILNSL